MKTKEPKTIIEAIDDLQMFLECDLFTKLKPDIDIDESGFIRKDYIKDENEFIEYMNVHFDILREQVKELTKSKDAYKKGKEALKRLRSRN